MKEKIVSTFKKPWLGLFAVVIGAIAFGFSEALSLGLFGIGLLLVGGATIYEGDENKFKSLGTKVLGFFIILIGFICLLSSVGGGNPGK